MSDQRNPKGAESDSILWISKTPEELRAEIAELTARLASAEAERDSLQRAMSNMQVHIRDLHPTSESGLCPECYSAGYEAAEAALKSISDAVFAWDGSKPTQDELSDAVWEMQRDGAEHKALAERRGMMAVKLVQAEAALKTAVEALEKITKVPRTSTPRVVFVSIAADALSAIRDQQPEARHGPNWLRPSELPE